MGSDQHDRAGRRAKPHGLVRPYVPSAVEWAGDRASRRAHDDDDLAAIWRDDPALSRPAITPPPTDESHGHRRPPLRYRLGGSRRRLVAVAAGVAVLALACVLIPILSRQPAKVAADTCRTAGCHVTAGNKPPARSHKATGHSPTAAKHPGRSPVPHPTSHRPRRSSPAPTPTRSRRASPSPTPGPVGPTVSISYKLVQQLPHKFEGQFTIVNNGSTPIDGWQLSVVLPGDNVRAVWTGVFHTVGDTLYIDPPSSQPTIAPGQTLTEHFSAHGTTTTPTSCTFNGSPC